MTVSPRAVGRAPAKTILSGEHAVVYGQPAIALALPRYAQVSISAASSGVIDPSIGVSTTSSDDHCELFLSDLNQHFCLDLSQLSRFSDQCLQRHRRFLNHELAIEAVLPEAADLYHYALAIFLSADPVLTSALRGCRIELSSEIAIGSGMGSSAATVSALLVALAGFSDTALAAERLIELTRRCEMLQHGRSSGLDPAICGRGGLLQFRQGEIETLPAALDKNWYLVDSGQPACSTGSCTSQVRQQFEDSAIWPEFGRVSGQLAEALKQQSAQQLIHALRINHRLLVRIGVVPEPVQRFIDAVEQRGGAAKISGSGAIRGEAGGLVLVYTEADPKRVLQPLTDAFGYQWKPMGQDDHGAQLRD